MVDSLQVPGRAASETGSASSINPGTVLAVVAVAQFMVVLDASVVDVALPAVQHVPRRQHVAESRDAQAAALASARCPGAPNCGHLTRQVVVGPRNRSVGMAG